MPSTHVNPMLHRFGCKAIEYEIDKTNCRTSPKDKEAHAGKKLIAYDTIVSKNKIGVFVRRLSLEEPLV